RYWRLQSSERNRSSRGGDFRNTGQSDARAGGMGCDVRSGKSPVLYCNWFGQVRASDAHRPAASEVWAAYWKKFQRKTMRTKTRSGRARPRGAPQTFDPGRLGGPSLSYDSA